MKYEVFDNDISAGFVELSDQPTGEELAQAHLIGGGWLVPGEMEDWAMDGYGEITIKHIFEDQQYTTTLLPVVSE